MNPNSENARVRAALINTGKYTAEEAEAKLAASSLSIYLGADVAETPAAQAAFLTAVVTGARCFGKVYVTGALETAIVLPVSLGAPSLGAAAVRLGATEAFNEGQSRWIQIGSGCDFEPLWSVSPYWNGWIAGVAPNGGRIGRGDCALAGIAAGGLAVGEAFLAEQGHALAGRFNQCISLWSPDECVADAENPAMTEIFLPRNIWMIGLGNLGQASLWALSMLPYERPEDVVLFIQDDDKVDPENWGTSILVEKGRYGLLKTFIAEEWAMNQRFNVRRIDRRVDRHQHRGEHEPAIALAGLDSMAARRLLGNVGFDCLIDCGLGATAENYTSYRVTVFHRDHNPADHFKEVDDQKEAQVAALMDLPVYKELAKKMNDGGCGAAILAGKSVAVPFVSSFAAVIAIAQGIRVVSGRVPNGNIVGTIGDLRNLRATVAKWPENLFFHTASVQI